MLGGRPWERWEDHVVVQQLEDAWGKEPRAALRRAIKDLGDKFGCRSVLDVGCGVGIDCPACVSAGMDYTGLDRTDGMLAAFERRNPGVRVLRGDVYGTGMPDGSFDAVLCSDVLIHVPYPETVLAELRRVCRKVLLLKLLYIAADRTRVTVDPNRGFFNIFYEPSHVVRMLKTVGFSEVEVRVVDAVDLANQTDDPRQIYLAVR